MEHTLEEFENDANGLKEHLLQVFSDSELAMNWFYEVNAALGGSSPFDFVQNGQAGQVEDVLTRIEHGIFD